MSPLPAVWVRAADSVAVVEGADLEVPLQRLAQFLQFRRPRLERSEAMLRQRLRLPQHRLVFTCMSSMARP
jgi:hypothetical protein